MPVSFALNQRERNLILEHVEGVDEEFVARLRGAAHDAARLNFQLSENKLMALTDAVLQKYKHTHDEQLREGLLEVMQEIEGSLDLSDSTPPAPSGPVEELMQEAARRIQERGVTTLEEANEIMAAVQHEYNHRPRGDLGGLAPYEAHRLFDPNWSDAHAGLHLRDDLPHALIGKTPWLANTRLLLRMAQEAGGVKATARGNLNTKSVRAYAEQMVASKDFHDYIRNDLKQWREDNIAHLGEIRFVAQLAGLIRKYKGAFCTTKKGEELLEDDNAGRLYALLFQTLFQRLDLACMDALPELPALQDTIAFSLFALHAHARDWIETEELSIHLFLPEVHAEIPVSSYSGDSYAPIAAHTRVLRPLEQFGLVESRSEILKDKTRRESVRITPLFDQFLTFDLSSQDES